jgi:hypothetical protein
MVYTSYIPDSLIAMLVLGCGRFAPGPIACGGSSKASTPPTSRAPTTSSTPVGSYQINITATSNGIQHALTLRVLVQ